MRGLIFQLVWLVLAVRILGSHESFLKKQNKKQVIIVNKQLN
jgi:hypothetical protein